MKATYYPEDDILNMRFSDKPITREISQDWFVNVSFAEDGTIVEMVILDAAQQGLMPLRYSSEAPARESKP